MSLSLGVLEQGALASINERGEVATGDVTVDWWVGADDRWHIPAREVSTSQRRVGAAPVTDTVVRVPGGDVVQRAYGAAVPSGGVVVLDIENRSPVPLTIALVVRIGAATAITVDGSVLCMDGRPVLAMSRPPRAWAAGETTVEAVTGGTARTGPIAAQQGPTELALLFPVPHRTSLRVALGEVNGVDPRALPDADAVGRGWELQLERGLQAALPVPIGDVVEAARADLLLRPRRAAAVVAALEDWGFDQEAASGWAGLGWRARRRARHREDLADPWAAVRAADASEDPARFLSALRAALVCERPGALDLLPGFPSEWLGQSITVDAVPLRSGSLSFAVRWHGARPALLWDAPSGLELHAPALDPAWSSNVAAGETLLAEPPAPLLPMGNQERSAGDPIASPVQFS